MVVESCRTCLWRVPASDPEKRVREVDVGGWRLAAGGDRHLWGQCRVSDPGHPTQSGRPRKASHCLKSQSFHFVVCCFRGPLLGDPDLSAFERVPTRPVRLPWPPSLPPTSSCCWSAGRNEKGQLGHGDTKRVEAPRLIEGLSHEVIVSAACGRNHTLALTGEEWLVSYRDKRPIGPP